MLTFKLLHIDVDFEHERREEVIRHIYERYGRHRAGLCATVVHYCGKRAIRDQLPEVLRTSPDYLIRGYSAPDRIVCGTGAIVDSEGLEAQAKAIFDDPDVAYTHVRSTRNDCYQARIDRVS